MSISDNRHMGRHGDVSAHVPADGVVDRRRGFWPRAPDRIDCPAVSSTVNYLGDMDAFPVFYSENYQNNNLNLVEHRIAVHDARPVVAQLALEEGGFVLVDHRTAVTDFTDAEQVASIYMPEITALVRELTGAPKVVTTRAVLRWSERAGDTTAFINSRPARFVHVDYSRQSFDDFARMHLAGAEVPDPQCWLAGRYVAYNFEGKRKDNDQAYSVEKHKLVITSLKQAA